MRLRLSRIVLVFLVALGGVAVAPAQKESSRRSFQGEWHWAVYAKDKSFPNRQRCVALKTGEKPAYVADDEEGEP